VSSAFAAASNVNFVAWQVARRMTNMLCACVSVARSSTAAVYGGLASAVRLAADPARLGPVMRGGSPVLRR
jgi:hypothetical protein